MKKFRIYRSLRVENIEDVIFENIGISWGADELAAEKFADQFNTDYIIISADVTSDQINISQTNAQWNNKDQGNEEEVVLNENIDIEIEYEGKKYQANTGWMSDGEIETRPRPEECEVSYVTDYLNEV